MAGTLSDALHARELVGVAGLMGGWQAIDGCRALVI